MRLNTRQAAERLKIHPSSVARLVKLGLLKDVAQANGKGRHHFQFESTDIADLIKSGKAPKPKPRTLKALASANGHHGPSRVTSLFDRMEGIERSIQECTVEIAGIRAQMDALLAMWR